MAVENLGKKVIVGQPVKILDRSEIIQKPPNKKSDSLESDFSNKWDIFVLFYLLHYGLKGIWVVHGQIGQDFSVELNTIGFYLTHELGVGHAVLSCTCIDTGDPQSAEISLFVPAVPVGI